MPIILVGLNHHSAPVALREQFSLAGDSLSAALAGLPVYPSVFSGDPAYDDLPYAPPALSEAVILSTCNRLEIYAVTRSAPVGQTVAESFLSRLNGVRPAVFRPHLYFMHDQEAVRHLMRVAAGLDSLILGEPQILGQVSSAFASAKSAGATGPVLSRLFAAAAHAGKRAHAETGISRHTTSVGHAAALLAQNRLGGLDGAHALVIGAGEMAGLAAQALKMRGAAHITCVNRTLQNAEALAAKVDGEAAAWADLPAALSRANVVISATAAPGIILRAADVAGSLHGRDGRPLVIVDIAVPRDIEVEVGNLPGVTCYDVDDLRSVLDEHKTQREAAIPHVESIVGEEVDAFGRWMNGLEVVPVIADLRAWAAGIAEMEVERTLEGLKDAGPDAQKAVELLAHRLVNKLLHSPTVTLRDQAERGNGATYGMIARELFALDEAEKG